MFLDIAPSEFLLTAIVAVVVIGPKDLPRALRTAGKWMGKMRRMSNHLRSGFDTMIREAELQEMEEAWRKQNAAIMAAHPPGSVEALPGAPTEPLAEHHADTAHADARAAEAAALPPPP
ncbi:MAG: Sec-independent protein translocase protein TatB [Sphingomonadales bacterium]|nr:Sec-independent protein translocase protein TatB [Sphingomonadales bacterium]